jgi:hypothetical protein
LVKITRVFTVANRCNFWFLSYLKLNLLVPSSYWHVSDFLFLDNTLSLTYNLKVTICLKTFRFRRPLLFWCWHFLWL